MRTSVRSSVTLDMTVLPSTLVNSLCVHRPHRRPPRPSTRGSSCPTYLWATTKMLTPSSRPLHPKNCKFDLCGVSHDPHMRLKLTIHQSKGEFLGQLISVMCENNEVGRLNALGFIGFQPKVEELLSFKARNSDPLRYPNYYKVLYSWHIARGDYRSGA